MPLRRRKVRRSTLANFSDEDLFQALNTRELEVICCSGELLLTRGGGDLALSLFHCSVELLLVSLSLLTVWFLSYCSDIRWRRSGVEKGGGYLVIDINYFPGYEKLSCYETVMTDFFLNLMKSHTVEKTTTDFDRPSDWIRRRRCRLMVFAFLFG
ncbi:hypothetical protein L6452_04389 [Arctium lappa]|uniref:Uncharacterized protein n=1 Tax=Arctium lappa TaxID=4217 RepID=A0ACB9FQU6_ARCLA|nr:hypothetical protein L6452_04389 [Arctium lappa]